MATCCLTTWRPETETQVLVLSRRLRGSPVPRLSLVSGGRQEPVAFLGLRSIAATTGHPPRVLISSSL